MVELKRESFIKSPTKMLIFATHPIQYFAPLYRELAKEQQLELTVIFGSGSTTGARYDVGFDKAFNWDIPLTEGYHHIFLDESRVAGMRDMFRQINRLIQDSDPDFIMISGYATRFEFLAILSTLWLGKKLLYRPEATDDPSFPPRSPLKQLIRMIFLKRLYRWTHAFLAIGTSAKSHFLRLGASKDKIFWSPYSADVTISVNSDISKSSAKDQLSISPQKIVIIFCGKFIDRKDPFALIDALKQLDRSTDFCVLMVGSGPNQTALENLAANLTATDIRFCGFKNQSELSLYYAASDIIALPSRFETWGLVVNEAMRFGCIPIVSDHVGCRHDLVMPISKDLIFETGNSSSLKQAIESATKDLRLMSSFQNQARSIISNFSFRQSALGILKSMGLA